MKKLVYIIDDDPIYQKFVENHFTIQEEFSVKVFSTGYEAVAQLSMRPFLIMLDHNLNEHKRCGLDYLQEIRSINPFLSILYMSSEVSPQLAERSKQLGALDFIAKDQAFPIRLRGFLDQLSHYSSKKEIIKRLFKQE